MPCANFTESKRPAFHRAVPRAGDPRVQYGNGVKAQAVYLSQYQLMPYQRVQEQFQDQLGLPISAGSAFTFDQQTHTALERFEQKLIAKLLACRVYTATSTEPVRPAQSLSRKPWPNTGWHPPFRAGPEWGRSCESRANTVRSLKSKGDYPTPGHPRRFGAQPGLSRSSVDPAGGLPALVPQGNLPI